MTKNQMYSVSQNSRSKRGIHFSVEYKIKELKNRSSSQLIGLETIDRLQMNKHTTFTLFLGIILPSIFRNLQITYLLVLSYALSWRVFVMQRKLCEVKKKVIPIIMPF